MTATAMPHALPRPAAQLLALCAPLIAAHTCRAQSNSNPYRYNQQNANQREAAENYGEIIAGVVVPVAFILILTCCLFCLVYSRRKRSAAGGGKPPASPRPAGAWHPTAFTSAGGGGAGYGSTYGQAEAAPVGGSTVGGYSSSYSQGGANAGAQYAATYGSSSAPAEQALAAAEAQTQGGYKAGGGNVSAQYSTYSGGQAAAHPPQPSGYPAI